MAPGRRETDGVWAKYGYAEVNADRLHLIASEIEVPKLVRRHAVVAN